MKVLFDNHCSTVAVRVRFDQAIQFCVTDEGVASNRRRLFVCSMWSCFGNRHYTILHDKHTQTIHGNFRSCHWCDDWNRLQHQRRTFTSVLEDFSVFHIFASGSLPQLQELIPETKLRATGVTKRMGDYEAPNKSGDQTEAETEPRSIHVDLR